VISPDQANEAAEALIKEKRSALELEREKKNNAAARALRRSETIIPVVFAAIATTVANSMVPERYFETTVVGIVVGLLAAWAIRLGKKPCTDD